ncbi:MAG: hypothetical protein EOP90_13120 [Lysobacteraceae bacterium]|nr:MAG: hypothetical protein EOP90_13120 [Xanthomonadaceae bacterium]
MSSISTVPRRRPLAAALALAGMIASTQPASASPAATHPVRHGPAVVTHCGDDGPGSLREAYTNAVDGAVIDLGQLTCSTITLASGALVDAPASGSVRVRGPAAGTGRTLTISGDHLDRVFVHNGEGSLMLENLSIEAGRRNGGNGGCVHSHGGLTAETVRFFDCAVSGEAVHGGAAFAEGDVSLVASSISGSSAAGTTSASGGAIHAGGNVVLLGSTVQANIAIAVDGPVRTGVGGGVYAAGEARIGYSTLTGNHAVAGGGVHAAGLFLYNSTLSGNTAEFRGAGVEHVGKSPLVIASSTIVFNRNDAGAGAGIYLDGPANLYSTIIAGNTMGFPGTASDIAGPPSSSIAGMSNLVGASTLPTPPDTMATDPLLDPLLQDNGGLTPTHALLPGSPAIDHGNNLFGLCCDQRWSLPSSNLPFERVVGTAADIGAYEAGAPDRVFDDGFEVALEKRRARPSTR